jgi:hypothetical protein
MIKFIAFTCCATCEHKKVKESSCHTHTTCDLDSSETDDYLVCGKWIMSEYLKGFTNKE